MLLLRTCAHAQSNQDLMSTIQDAINGCPFGECYKVVCQLCVTVDASAGEAGQSTDKVPLMADPATQCSAREEVEETTIRASRLTMIIGKAAMKGHVRCLRRAKDAKICKILWSSAGQDAALYGHLACLRVAIEAGANSRLVTRLAAWSGSLKCLTYACQLGLGCGVRALQCAAFPLDKTEYLDCVRFLRDFTGRIYPPGICLTLFDGCSVLDCEECAQWRNPRGVLLELLLRIKPDWTHMSCDVAKLLCDFACEDEYEDED